MTEHPYCGPDCRCGPDADAYACEGGPEPTDVRELRERLVGHAVRLRGMAEAFSEPGTPTHEEITADATAVEQAAAALERLEKLEKALHARCAHPDYEYTTTEGARKAFDDEEPPEGAGWVRNIHEGRDGWERFDYHEEAYWMRPKLAAPAPAPQEGAP